MRGCEGPRTRGSHAHEQTPKRDRPGRGRHGQRIADRKALKGTKTSREASDERRGVSVNSATLLRAAHVARIGPVMTASPATAGGHADWFGKLRDASEDAEAQAHCEHDAARATRTGEKTSQAAAREQDRPAQANTAGGDRVEIIRSGRNAHGRRM